MNHNDNPHSDEQALQEILAIVHTHFGSLETICMELEKAGLSERDWDNLFRQYLHTTPAVYLRQYRLDMACRMLTQTNKSVSRISEECGMSVSYLCKRIREITGCTPLEYRRNYFRNRM